MPEPKSPVADDVPVSDYDKFAYPSAIYSQTHPDRLATVATLHGLQPARIEQARVLELGCGDGNNLISMALTLPDSTFHGVDLAVEPIRRGNEVIAAVGLKNISLRQMNILEMPADLGVFDYIIAHGLYAWVPEAVREKILAICREHLSENGVAYISYNAYPGCHLRDIARGITRFHARQFSEPLDQVRQGRALLKYVAESHSEPRFWQQVVRDQFQRLDKRSDPGFFHDELGAVNQPFYFHEFMEAASRHQLEYINEADVRGTRPGGLTEEGNRILDQMERINRIAYEQYLDFVVGRPFRQTLLCRQGRGVDREMKPERIGDLFAAADVVPVNAGANMMTPGLEDFKCGETVIAAGKPVHKLALKFLGEVWPRRVPFNVLLRQSQERAGCGEATVETDRRNFALFLIECFTAGHGFVGLHSYPSTFVTKVSDCPVASPLVRWQIRQGLGVSSLRHQPLRIEDALGRELLMLLDGTRDHAALLKELGDRVKGGTTPIYSDGKQVVETQKALEILASQLDPSLANLARLGLLAG